MQMAATHFASPRELCSPVTVAVSKAWANRSQVVDMALERPWQVISPPEPLHALILAVGRDCMDVEKHEVVKRWRRVILSLPVQIVSIENEMEIYWQHLSLREQPGIEYELVRCSALQRILQINHFASKLPEHGVIVNQKLAKIIAKTYRQLAVADASEKITPNFVFSCLEAGCFIALCLYKWLTGFPAVLGQVFLDPAEAA